MTVRRLVAILLSVLAALALGLGTSTPAAAQSTSSYSAQLDSITLDMRALWGELDRFQPRTRYCLPPGEPNKAQDQATLDALEARVKAMNARYTSLKQGLKTFLANNPRLYAELMVNNIDPGDRRWWARYDASQKKMNDELARKKAALARAPEVDCSPKPKPVTVGTTGAQPSSQGVQRSSLPPRPSIDPLGWPAMPPYFCSWEEYWKFIIEQINPRYEKAAEDAEKAARFRTQVEVQVNNLVQADKPVPPALAALRRQAIADVAEQDRLFKESEEIRRRAKAIPVIDCRKQGTQTGAAPQTAPPQVGMDQSDVRRVQGQQEWISGIETDIAKLEPLRLAGKCTELYAEAELIRREISEMSRVAAFRPDGTRSLVLPPQLMAELRRRLANATEPCPPVARPTQTSSLPPPPAGSAAARILDVHNRERSAVGVASLQWDPALAASASAYAGQLARGGPFVHAPRAGRENERENLSRGLPGASPERMMENWTGEKRNFTPGTYPDVSKTGSWYDVSHYTQMIWPTTTRVGCGTAGGSKYAVLVCRYTPPGNQPGRQVLAERPELGKLPVGGGMQQIDPPPPPRPTAADNAPDGNEALHPLATLFAGALNRHYEALRTCDRAAAERALDEMRYALDELRKRLKAARAVGGFSTVNPDALQRLIEGLERVLRGAEQRSQPGTCPPR